MIISGLNFPSTKITVKTLAKPDSYCLQPFPSTKITVKTLAKPPSYGTINSGIPDKQGMVNYTKFYRDPKLLRALPKYLSEKFPNGAQIYCYACSDGSEPYTLAIEMMEQKINKFFPLQCFDLSRERIDEVKQGIINIFNKEIQTRPALNKYFKEQKYGTTYASIFNTYNPTDELKEKITAQEANILEDIEKEGKFEKPAVVMFRNAWYLLSPPYTSKDQRPALAKALYDRLKHGSLLILGRSEFSGSTDFMIEKAGFKPVKKEEFKYPEFNNYFVYEKP